MRRERVGARLDDEVRITARLLRGEDLLDHLLGRDDLLALHVAAALGPDLVLEHHAGHARVLERAHRVVDVDGVAVAGVGIGEQCEIGAAREYAHRGEVVLETHQADVGHAEPRLAEAAAGDEGRVETHVLDEPRAEAVVHRRQRQDFRRIDEGSQGLGMSHVVS